MTDVTPDRQVPWHCMKHKIKSSSAYNWNPFSSIFIKSLFIDSISSSISSSSSSSSSCCVKSSVSECNAVTMGRVEVVLELSRSVWRPCREQVGSQWDLEGWF